jgi:hypothetical protein
LIVVRTDGAERGSRESSDAGCPGHERASLQKLAALSAKRSSIRYLHVRSFCVCPMVSSVRGWKCADRRQSLRGQKISIESKLGAVHAGRKTNGFRDLIDRRITDFVSGAATLEHGAAAAAQLEVVISI